MSHTDVVERFSRSIELRDVEAVCKCFMPDAIYHDAIYGEHVGRDAIGELVSAVQRQASDFVWTNHRIVADKDAAYAEFTLRLRTNDAPGKTGRTLSVSGVISLVFEGGLIREYREYMDVGLTLLELGYNDQAIIEQLRERARGNQSSASGHCSRRLHLDNTL